ncbi:hypothetical protein RAM_29700 [Amycolatopsis mediterranei S699]|uniref:Uncharacterized protein n=1 Tax=Amycolatopsis mediterranei (strain S699) TaxID=713604 RepID=A0A9R0UB71_AMYMS|nr:hypothetical protein RAM_29700 [Amycolatopsis mediterranei S699]
MVVDEAPVLAECSARSGLAQTLVPLVQLVHRS